MTVMPSNNSGYQVRELCEEFPSRIGWLISPGGWRRPPAWKPDMPIALDNGAFGVFLKRTPWPRRPWLKLLRKSHQHCRPLWAVAPDVVSDREATIAKWHQWYPLVRHLYPYLPLAFAVQDGMRPDDVPDGVHTIFVGGSTAWKWRYLRMWTEHFQRVHVARVNTERLLWMAHSSGAISCDGTGWMRGDRRQLSGLKSFLRQSRFGGRPTDQQELALFTA